MANRSKGRVSALVHARIGAYRTSPAAPRNNRFLLRKGRIEDPCPDGISLITDQTQRRSIDLSGHLVPVERQALNQHLRIIICGMTVYFYLPNQRCKWTGLSRVGHGVDYRAIRQVEIRHVDADNLVGKNFGGAVGIERIYLVTHFLTIRKAISIRIRIKGVCADLHFLQIPEGVAISISNQGISASISRPVENPCSGFHPIQEAIPVGIFIKGIGRGGPSEHQSIHFLAIANAIPVAIRIAGIGPQAHFRAIGQAITIGVLISIGHILVQTAVLILNGVGNAVTIQITRW